MVKHRTLIKNVSCHQRMKTVAMNTELRMECINKNTCNQNCKSMERQEGKGKRKSERLYEDYETQTSICVSPLPKTITKEQLALLMGRFGKILKSHMGRNFFLVEYDTREAVNTLFSKSDWLQNETLCLKKIERKNLSYLEDKDDNPNEDRAPRPIKKAKENKSIPTTVTGDLISYSSNVRHIIEKIPEFENEMAALLETIQLTEFEIRTKYDIVCGHLEEIFKSVFPQCRLYRFGSTMAGLAFKDSDLDMYMHIGDVGPRSTHYKPDLSFQEYAQAVLKRLKRIMYSRTTVFSNIIAIPKARTPVIKFCYVPTNVSCDITFKNCFGIYKTNFLKFCALYDVRVNQMMLLIKYWAKEYKLTGVGRMPNYGLMCIVIFYLQTIDILPTLTELRKDCTSLFVGDWQVNFNENYKRTVSPASDNDQSVVDLLYGFFQFIKESFALMPDKKHCGVFSLLDGKTYEQSDFDEVDSLPSYMGSYKYHVLQENGRKLEARSPFGIQDPIELNQNAIINANESTLRDLNYYCCFAVNCIETARQNNCKNLLKNLLEKSLPPPPPLKVKHRIHIGRFMNVGLPADFDSRTDIYNKWEYKKNNWCFTVFNLIKDILEMIFKFTVSVYVDNETCIGKVDVLSDELVKKHEEIQFHCTASKCVWLNRMKHNTTFLDVQLSYLEKEATISDKMLKELDEQNEQDNINFRCKYIVRKTPKLEAVDIKLFQEKTQQNIYDLSSYLHRWIPQIIDKTMAHMLQYNKPYSQLYHCREQKAKQTVNEHCS